MQLDEVIKMRKSIRKFKPNPISEDNINQLMEAARLAPSGLNLQSTRYVVIRDQSIKERIAQRSTSKFLTSTPVIIACCMDNNAFGALGVRVRELEDSGVESSSLALFKSPEFQSSISSDNPYIKVNLIINAALSMEHIILKAVDLGLGACWIATFDKEDVKDITGLDERYEVLSLLAIGYPEGETTPKSKISVDELIIKSMG